MPVLLLVIAGCSAPLSSDAPSVPVPTPVAGEGRAACPDLSESECMGSTECTFEVAENGAGEAAGYICRAAEAPCETGFRQRGDGREVCEAKEGCAFEPGQCYCPPDVTCFCGGGPPPTCRPATA